MNPINDCPRVGPYVGVQRDVPMKFTMPDACTVRHFRVLLYAAYNAMGLIGSEGNGICILDEDNKEVLCDELAKIDSGYFGASATQQATLRYLVGGSWTTFRSTVNTSPRRRWMIDAYGELYPREDRT